MCFCIIHKEQVYIKKAMTAMTTNDVVDDVDDTDDGSCTKYI